MNSEAEPYFGDNSGMWKDRDTNCVRLFPIMDNHYRWGHLQTQAYPYRCSHSKRDRSRIWAPLAPRSTMARLQQGNDPRVAHQTWVVCRSDPNQVPRLMRPMVSLTQAQWRPRSSQSNAFLVRLTCNSISTSISCSDSNYNNSSRVTKHTIKRSSRSTSTN